MPRETITNAKTSISPIASRYGDTSRFQRMQPSPNPKNAENSSRFVKYEMADFRRDEPDQRQLQEQDQER
jgi:hypothetical protein